MPLLPCQYIYIFEVCQYAARVNLTDSLTYSLFNHLFIHRFIDLFFIFSCVSTINSFLLFKYLFIWYL